MKFKNKFKFINLLIAVTLYSNSYAQDNIVPKISIEGKWVTHDQRAVVKIFKDGETYSGVIDSVLVDIPDKTLVGITVLKDFTFRKNKFIGGTMHDPETKGIYKSKLWLENSETLKIRDYCGLFYMTFSWTRFK